ncbi:PREDICTED: uncharacterized protein y4mH-like [Priapulus caudatus]|uniref:Uncharacterized protein y4mH-like n=1 Tax=Priapulus caudatus TaxID=37621 RepID=A0ABM1ESA3_PRICU|nr:PREDICTED: uncharacterized protein y4mH-like [Priapulus caudatus]
MYVILDLWELDRFNYKWPSPDLNLIYRNFYPTDLEKAMSPTPVRSVIAVQVLNDSEIETWHNLQLAKKHPFIKAVVGWVDLTNPNVEQNLVTLAENPLFVGVRDILDEHEDNWMLSGDVQRALHVLDKLQLTFDLLVRPRHLKYALQLVENFPGLKIVVDHIAKPLIKERVFKGWEEDMAELAKHSNVFCKLSGFVNEADPTNWKSEDFKPYINHIVSCFGPHRCMFGSDWPVCMQSNASYADVYNTLKDCLKHLTEENQRRIFGQNAAEFYSVKTLLKNC